MRKLLLVFLFAFAACTEPLAPQDSESFTPPVMYPIWWEEAAVCSGRTEWDRVMSFERIEWWVVPGAGWEDKTMSPGIILGMWDRPRIYIAEAYLYEKWIVKHEMLHALGFSHPYAGVYPWPFEGCTD
jgi:hypothetical protein